MILKVMLEESGEINFETSSTKKKNLQQEQAVLKVPERGGCASLLQQMKS